MQVSITEENSGRPADSGIRKYFRHFLKSGCLLLVLTMMAVPAYAQYTTDLVICLDASGSMSATDWTTQKSGTTAGLTDALDPDFLDGSVRVSVVQFPVVANNNAYAGLVIGPTVIDSEAVLNSFNSSVNALSVPGGGGTRWTNIASCIDVARATLGCTVGSADTCPVDGVRRIIDISTDGNPNRGTCSSGTSQQCAIARSDSAEAAGVDVINVIAVGNVSISNATAWAFPTPVLQFDTGGAGCDAAPYPASCFPVPGDEGFVVEVQDFNSYLPAIYAKLTAELLSSVFTVNKSYSDGNNTPVSVTATCVGGNGSITSANPRNAAPGSPAVFTYSGYTIPPTSCTAVETGVPAGYLVDNSDCQDGNLLGTSCTIVNTLDQASITVVKNTIGDDGVFNIGINGPAASSYPLVLTTVGNTASTSVNVAPTGIFSISESVPSGWDLSNASCVDQNGGATVGTWDGNSSISNINLVPGDAITCTFTNARDGSFNLIKNTVGGEGSFDFVTDIAGATNINIATSGGTGQLGSSDVPAGTYNISEVPQAGWVLDSATCSDGSSPSAVDLSNGESVTCTFTNTKLGTIIVEKQTLPDGDSQTFGFTGDVAGTIADGGQITIANVSPGTYTSTETAVAGWDLTGIVCDDTGPGASSGSVATATATFNVQAGETVKCTFTNTKRGSIEVVKTLSATGPAVETFGFTSTFNGAFNLAGNGATTGAIEVVPGNNIYSVNENDPTSIGWANVSATCTGGDDPRTNIIVSPGEDVVCTFVNTPLGSATIVKNTIGGNGTFNFIGTAPFNGLELITSNGTASQDFSYQLVGGNYQVTESPIPAGWDITSIGCEEDGIEDSVGVVSTATADMGVELNETVTCTFTNTADGTLIIRKQTLPDASTPAFTFTGDVAGSIRDYSATSDELSISGQPRTYTSTETVPAGWELTNISCTGQSASDIVIGGTAAFEDGDTDVQVGLAAGETVICTFENTKLGSITINKASVGDVGSFNFNAPAGLGGGFALDTTGANPASASFNDLLPGSYLFSELVPSNWRLTGISCSGDNGVSIITIGGAGGFDQGDTGVTIDLADGENIACTFTNTKQANLALVKSVTNNNGGTAVAADWTLSATGPNNLSGAGGVAATFVGLGNYTLSESAGPGGYVAGNWSCTDGVLNGSTLTLGAGDVAVCTIINDDEPASLALVKSVTNNNGGSAVAADWTLSAAGPTPISGAGGVASTPVNAGVYTLSESAGPGGYTAGAWSCTGGSLSGSSLTLGSGESATCTIINDDNQGSLALVKSVTNDNGGSAAAADWTLSAAGPTPISGAGGVASTPVDAGVYTLSESAGPAGYTAGAWSCTAGSLSGSSLTLAVGESATCTIINDDNQGSLALIKSVTNDNGGSAVAADWTLSAAGPTPISGAGGVASTPVDAGIYTLSESAGPGGYTAGGWSCTGAGSLSGDQLTLGSGESATCTIINDDNAPGLTLVKTVTNDDGGSAAITDWTLNATDGAQTTISGVSGSPAVTGAVVDAGTYQLSESGGPSGYTAGSWSCVGGTQQGSSVILGVGETVVCTINNDDDPANLALVKTVTNDNGGSAVAADWTLTAAGPTPLSGAGGVVSTPVNAGVYTLSESAGPGGYTAGAWSCTAGSLAGSTLTLASGESATCTINNDDNAPGLTLVKTVTNDDGGTAAITDWTLNATDGAQTTITGVSGSPAVTGAVVDAGTYQLSESGGPSGYTAGAWACVGGTQQGSSVTLGVGETVVCTINNDDDPASLALVKTVTNDHQGSAVAEDWTLAAAGPTPLSGQGGVASALVDAGTYTLTETGGPDGYTAGAWSCTAGNLQGNVLVLESGEDAVCTINNDDDPAVINLAKTVNGAATLEQDGTYTVVYTITATSTGGPGVYSLVDAFSPGSGITLVTATAAYVAGSENDQTGTLGNYPNFVTGEDLASGLNESWTVTASFAVNSNEVTSDSSQCSPGAPEIGSGFYNAVSGSSTDPDLSDNDTCTGLPEPGINLAKTVNGPATLEQDGSYTVEYTIVATNTGGPGSYNLVDAFAPGAGITLDTATATYVAGTENDQSGTLAAYPNFVTNEGLGDGLNESWTVSANFTVEPALVDSASSQCSPGTPVINTGFYNAVSGSSTDSNPSDDQTCTGLPQPIINLAKAVNGPATLEQDGTYTVVYTITATNTGGPGSYNLVDAFAPGAGITLDTAAATYVAGTEDDQSGTLAAYPNFVTNEGLAAGLNESWTVTGSFAVDSTQVDPTSSQCSSSAPVINTGFYNAVSGSSTDNDLTDNDACTGLPEPSINLSKTVNGPATLEQDGSYTVVYTITATNTGGPGAYDLVDAFAPGAGITLDTATATYMAGTENDQSGTLAAYPNFVSNEGLAAGLNESWTVTGSFGVDPIQVSPGSSQCSPGTPVINTGFYNAVSGSSTDSNPSDDQTCTGLPQPIINLAKTVNGPATLEQDGTYTVVYTITATNTGGPGSYDLVDAFAPGAGITLDTATATYVAGTEDDQSGTLAAYPNFVTNEGLAAGLNESWTVTGSFAVDSTQVDPTSSQCSSSAPVINTGFYNAVSGSGTDIDLSDNDTCTGLSEPGINLAKTVNGPATLEQDGSYTVEYTIVATNTGGPGSYNLVDAFAPGAGITLDTATATYVAGTEDDQSGTLAGYPNFVTNEALGDGLYESWTVTASFTVNPEEVDSASSQCSASAPVIDTGFYNAVSGSDTDPDLVDNDTCTGLPQPGIDLSKVVRGGAVLEDDGTYTVEYIITATNTGGPGVYNLVDALAPGAGITHNTVTAVYVAGTEDDQSGTLAAYPNFVTNEGLAAGLNESWTVTANFTVNQDEVDPVSSQCSASAPAINTGFYNAVSGSSTDTDSTDNQTCIGLEAGTLTLIKVLEGDGEAVPADFALTLTGTDGVHDSGVDYYNGASPEVKLGVQYEVTEVADQDPDYSLEGIVCTDDNSQTVLPQPFMVNVGQAVTCTVTNIYKELLIDSLAGVCINDIPYVSYDVSTLGVEPLPTSVEVSFFSDGGLGSTDPADYTIPVGSVMPNLPLTGQELWPGATVDQSGNGLTWPGWEEQPDGTWIEVDDGLVPSLLMVFEVNPTSQQIVNYPPRTANCVPPNNPPPPPPYNTVPVPVNSPWAIILMILSMLGMAWYFRPARVR